VVKASDRELIHRCRVRLVVRHGDKDHALDQGARFASSRGEEHLGNAPIACLNFTTDRSEAYLVPRVFWFRTRLLPFWTPAPV
jgi:hypothetical protein